jgi:hypothetical protein
VTRATVQEAAALESAAAEVLGRAIHEALGAGLVVLHEQIAGSIRQFDADFVEARDLRRAAEKALRRPAYDLDDPALIDPALATEPECCS